ncbi:hypothetical protein RhiirC2_774961 [Rhizophagus irregularis]|uniref:Uncharacterized protein n=1 Tax=Rhizophagus irregularis TaxID=588596 RepID=A0A2N1NK43_9GLOM|nr:hypothetical protein RhiirC2_774961 [Rhizophagus irregularis]
MKFILMFIIVIVAFSAFALANEPRITPVEKSSSLVARAGTCPSGTYACADKEGGCCSDGTSCLPNFQCSGSGKSSGATSTTSQNFIDRTKFFLICGIKDNLIFFLCNLNDLNEYFVFPLFQFSNIASTINKLTHTRNELQYSESEIVEAEVYVLIMANNIVLSEQVFNDESDETEDSKTNEKLNINNSEDENEFDINEIIDNTSFKF